MIINTVIRISDDSFYYYSSRGVDIVSRECSRIGYPLAREMSTITYKAHTWKATHGYRIQGDSALWVRVDVFPI